MTAAAYFLCCVVVGNFIILNLFIVNVLDTFDVEMRIDDRTVKVSDQWGFAFVWAETARTDSTVSG